MPWLEKEKVCDAAPPGVKDDESGAEFNLAQGKGFLTPAAPRTGQRMTCKSSLPEFLNN